MRTLTVKSEGTKPFQLLENNQILAELNYPKWYGTFQAELSSAKSDSVLTIKASGFWKSQVELWEGEECIAKSTLNWNLSVIISINGKEYLLKMKSLTEGLFVLMDSDKNELLYIDADMDWSNLKASYHIWFNEGIKTDLSNEILLFLVHNCNYFSALSGNASCTEYLAAM